MSRVYRVRHDGDIVRAAIAVTNPTEATLRECELELNEIDSLVTIEDVDKAVGSWDEVDQIWSGFSLKPGETQILTIEFQVTDIDREGGFGFGGSLTNCYSGEDPTSNSFSFYIQKENDEPISRLLKMRLIQTGTNAPTRANLFNGFQVTPTFARSSAGVYTITMANSFYSSYTVWNIEQIGQPTAVKHYIEYTNGNVLTLRTFDADGIATDLEGSLYITIETFND